MALTLDRSTLALDGRKLMLHVGPRTVALAISETEAQADGLHQLLEAGQHDRLVVRRSELKVNVRWELVLVVAGQDVPHAQFNSETDAALWSAVVSDDAALPALPDTIQRIRDIDSDRSLSEELLTERREEAAREAAGDLSLFDPRRSA